MFSVYSLRPCIVNVPKFPKSYYTDGNTHLIYETFQDGGWGYGMLLAHEINLEMSVLYFHDNISYAKRTVYDAA
jgi:hypothetical protein